MLVGKLIRYKVQQNLALLSPRHSGTSQEHNSTYIVEE